jgi:hypothetical protein
MRVLAYVFGAAVLAAASPAIAGRPEAQAPPMLSPAVARDVADACPGTAAAAAALVRGITSREAAAAEPAFAKCAARDLSRGFLWKRDAATVALAATQLSRGLLDHDAGLLHRAADATAELRSRSLATDDQIRAWPVIPDSFDVKRNEIVAYDYIPRIWDNANRERSPYYVGSIIPDAAYINVASRSGDAWIRTPRTATRNQYGGRVPVASNAGIPGGPPYPERPAWYAATPEPRAPELPAPRQRPEPPR